MFGRSTPLQLADTNRGALHPRNRVDRALRYGPGGWSTRSTLPLLGSVRSAAQVISYERPWAYRRVRGPSGRLNVDLGNRGIAAQRLVAFALLPRSSSPHLDGW